MESIIKALKINQGFSSPLSALSPVFVRADGFSFFIRANLLGVFGNMAGLTVTLRDSPFNLILFVLADAESQQISPAGSWSD